MNTCNRSRKSYRSGDTQFVEHLPNYIVVIVFLVLQERDSPRPDSSIAASGNPRRVSPPLVPSPSPSYDTSRGLDSYRLQSPRTNKPRNGRPYYPTPPLTTAIITKNQSRNPSLSTPAERKEGGGRKSKKGEAPVPTFGWVGQPSGWLDLPTSPGSGRVLR